ncbi:MAG: mannose-1-phosphate guanylyltransferase [Rikenellaceae bacterium]
MNNKYCIIMAGGVGTRFWPMSRKSMPKQFLDILGTGKTFLRQTYERFAGIIAPENFIVVTNSQYKEIVLEQIPELSQRQILCEPKGRNTAPCVAYAAFTLLKRDPDATMIVTPADNYISDDEHFISNIEECTLFAENNNALITIGIKPSRPETGYGYIQYSDKSHISRVKCFTEKPCLEIAQTLIQCGEFLWNSGIFVWKACDIITAFEQHMPDLHHLFQSIVDDIDTDRQEQSINKVYSECKSISIDHGVMERADNVYVRCGDFSWSDVGTWSSRYQLSRKDAYANHAPESAILYDTRGSIISMPEDKLAVISGLKDYIVVDTEDLLMICPQSEQARIKQFIEDVKYKSGKEFV